MSVCDGHMFSTKDRDNDVKWNNGSCAVNNKGAWWYEKCFEANLNGVYQLQGYYMGTIGCRTCGLEWRPWKGRRYSLKFTEMKLRPKY